METSDELLELWDGIGNIVVCEIPVQLIDINVVPHTFEWNIRITVAVNHGLDDTDVLVAPATLMEAEGPELLHGGRADAFGLELSNGLQGAGCAIFVLAAEEIEIETAAESAIGDVVVAE